MNGRVLCQCQLEELKKEMNMNFGDWHLFKAMVRYYNVCYLLLRMIEKQSFSLIPQITSSKFCPLSLPGFLNNPSSRKTSETGLQSGKHVVCVDQISICATTNECCVANKQAAIWSKMAALRMNEGYCQWELSIHSKI